jgi:hypothetical protein
MVRTACCALLLGFAGDAAAASSRAFAGRLLCKAMLPADSTPS